MSILSSILSFDACCMPCTVCSGVQRVLLSGQGTWDLENSLSEVCAILCPL